MESSSESVSFTEEATADQLKTELSHCIGQMQSSRFRLRLSHRVRRCKVLVVFLLVLVASPVVIGELWGPDIGTAAGIISFVVFGLALGYFCFRLPWSKSLVSDLGKDATALCHNADLLKRRVEAEVWIRTMSSRWSSVEALQKTGADVRDVVETLRSVVNSYLLSELSKKLKECQRHLRNI